MRGTLIFFRSPRVFLSLIGISVYVGFLLLSIYSGVGGQTIDFFNQAKTQRTISNWIGLSLYLNLDSFAACFFSNVICMNLFLPVFKREFNSGLYTARSFYFSNWLMKVTFLTFYPLMIFGILFHFLDLADSSTENLLNFMLLGSALAINACSLGHMWA